METFNVRMIEKRTVHSDGPTTCLFLVICRVLYAGSRNSTKKIARLLSHQLFKEVTTML